ncbi:Hypothetical protein FKW44_011544 [Caligus rogercresseyi]|uniref:Uncharacterized protein n=1 Tax=Caligus rogercresseyi TaxID=217165 RepID=A0A7T8HJD5_CALRO|nr:Hypothetical protein FKW44_011544 [Caligus rogercresseyi]
MLIKFGTIASDGSVMKPIGINGNLDTVEYMNIVKKISNGSMGSMGEATTTISKTFLLPNAGLLDGITKI